MFLISLPPESNIANKGNRSQSVETREISIAIFCCKKQLSICGFRSIRAVNPHKAECYQWKLSGLSRSPIYSCPHIQICCTRSNSSSLAVLFSANSCSGCPQWQVISGQLFFSGLSAQEWQCYKSFSAELHELIWTELCPNLLCFLLAKIVLKALHLVAHLQRSCLIMS